MKKVKTILLRLFFYFIAIQILNLSIDFDYLRCSNSNWASQSDNYDDIDSYAEFIMEKIAGNDNLVSENDDDNGQAKNVVRVANIVLISDQFVKSLPQPPKSDLKTFWTAGLDQRNKICKGYFSILIPPPKA